MSKVNINRKYKTPKAVLRACLRLFEEDPRNWTQHMRRRPRESANGGVAFCALGGIAHFAADADALAAAEGLLRVQLPNEITQVNDRRGRKAILTGLRKAVAA